VLPSAATAAAAAAASGAQQRRGGSGGGGGGGSATHIGLGASTAACRPLRTTSIPSPPAQRPSAAAGAAQQRRPCQACAEAANSVCEHACRSHQHQRRGRSTREGSSAQTARCAALQAWRPLRRPPSQTRCCKVRLGVMPSQAKQAGKTAVSPRHALSAVQQDVHTQWPAPLDVTHQAPLVWLITCAVHSSALLLPPPPTHPALTLGGYNNRPQAATAAFVQSPLSLCELGASG
jgi:hypothetical protein